MRRPKPCPPWCAYRTILRDEKYFQYIESQPVLFGIAVAGAGYDVEAFASDTARFAADTGKPLVVAAPQIAAVRRNARDRRQRNLQRGQRAVGNTPDEFARLIAAELQKWDKVVAATGVKLE